MYYNLTEKEIYKIFKGKLKPIKVIIPQNQVFIPITGKFIKRQLVNKRRNLEDIIDWFEEHISLDCCDCIRNVFYNIIEEKFDEDKNRLILK